VVEHRQGAVLQLRQDHAEYAARARNLDDASGVDFIKEGDAKGAMAGAAKTISAEFTTEHVAHACMEPMNATAMVNGEKIEVWAPSQSPFFIFLATSVRLGYKPENVTSHVTLLGGGFGRRVEADYVTDAALLAKAMEGKPVKWCGAARTISRTTSTGRSRRSASSPGWTRTAS